MRNINNIFPLLVLLPLIALSCVTDNPEKVEVLNYNTIRITGHYEESNNINPEENRRILPYVLDEDKLDLLGGGAVIELSDNHFQDPAGILEKLKSMGFEPTHYVYYNNTTRNADTICIYEYEKLIYFSRTASSLIPLDTIGPFAEKIESEELNSHKNISIWLTIYPEKGLSGDSALYSASCSISNVYQKNAVSGLFNDAEIVVNNIPLRKKHDDFFTLAERDRMTLKTGDSLRISINHELLGTISGKLTVPPSPSDFSVEPDVTTLDINESDQYLLSWLEGESDQYYVQLSRSDRSGELDSYARSVEGTFLQWDSWELQEDGKIVPYIRFSIRGCNRIELEDFNEWSEISITSPTSIELGNY